MGLNQGNNRPTTRLNGIRLSQAVLGVPLPVLIGQQRISWQLLWYGAFTNSVAKQQSTGGSGAGKSGAQYVYTASVVGGLCMGPCVNFLGVWDSIGKYQMRSASEGATLPSSGSITYTPQDQVNFKLDLGVGIFTPYSLHSNDFGAPGSGTISGTQVGPLIFTTSPTPGPGQYTIVGLPSNPVYVFNPAQAGANIVVNYSAYRYNIVEEELDVAAASVTVQYQSEWKSDVGVSYYPSGVALTVVSGTPTVAGTYNPNHGHYLFAPADFGLGVTINYIYQNPNTDTNAPSTLNLTFFGGALGQAPWSYLSASFPSVALGYSEIAYVGSVGLYMGYSPVLPQLNFEILGPFSFGSGIPDANPADAIYGLLTNPIYKYNVPTPIPIDISLLGSYSTTGSVTSGAFATNEVVKQGVTGATATLIGTVTGSNPMTTGLIVGTADFTHTWVGQTSGAIYTPTAIPVSSSARAMWSANNFFISEILDSQTSLMDTLSRWCEAGQVYISWDEGKLKFIPLSDVTAVANGVAYAPPTQPIIDLDDNDFKPDPNKDPISITQTPWQNRWNRISVRWSVRTNDYNSDILQIQDEASVQQYGLMSETAQDYQFLCTENAAQFAANMRLQRFSAIYTKYKFTLRSNFAFLSPGDIVTVTDGLLNTAGTLFGRTPIRITKMSDDPEKGIVIEAENFPWSVGTAKIYNKQAQLPSNTNDGPQQDPGNTTAVIFEVPNRAQQWAGGRIYIFCNGANVNWGGFEVYVSFNGTDYTYYGQYSKPGRIGITTNDLPPHADPDNTDTLTVNMQQSGAVLQSVTAADRDAFVTLSALITPGGATNPTKVAQTGTQQGAIFGGLPGSIGPSSPTTDTQIPPYVGAQVWTNPDAVRGNSSFASVYLFEGSGTGGPGQFSNYIACSGFGFAVPNGSGQIDGLTVTVTGYTAAVYQRSTSIVCALTYKGTVIGTLNPFKWSGNTGVPITPTGSDVLGSATDLNIWGMSPGFLTPAIVNDPSFGVVIRAAVGGLIDPSNTATIFAQNVKVTINWAAAGSGSAWVNPQNVSSSTAYATSLLTSPPLTQWLQASDFGFQLPFGFTPAGITVVISAANTDTVNGALLAVQLMWGGQRIGSPKSINVLSFSGSPTDFTFGTASDLWGITPTPTIDLLNSGGINGFSVALIFDGVTGNTVSVDNIRVTITGASGTNLELISYEGATLVGLNTYDLTSLRRGVYGSVPCDHPAGATFARMDQASITYDIDPNFTGSTIYFKFLSFNAYGNQLQSLAMVSAYAVPINNLAPGAIDIATGKLTTGTPNFPVASMETAFNAVHGSFGVQNIPYGYALMGREPSGGTPIWVPLDGSGGSVPGVNDVYVYVPPIAGTYGPNQELFFAQPVRIVTFPAFMIGSHGGCRVAPTANVQMSLNKNGIQFGTVNIAAGSLVATFTMLSSVTFDGNIDQFSITAPVIVDRTLAGFWLDVYASRSN